MIDMSTPQGHRRWHGQIPLQAIAGYHGRRVAVTGGAGFIGSSLCRILLAAQARVTVVDNLVNGRVENLPVDRGGHPTHLEVVVADVRDEAAMSRVLSGTDVLFHLACLGVRHSLDDPTENFEVNATGTLRVLEAARRARVPHTVHVSSSEVYGDARVAPMTEAHPTEPHTVYGAGKLAGEACARALYRTHGFDVVVIRPFNAYGPRSHSGGDSGEVIPRFVVQALHGDPLQVFGDGHQTRDFSHVHDTAATIARAGVIPGLAGEVFNVGSGEEVSIDHLAQMVRQVTASPSPVVHSAPRPGDVARLIADSAKAARVLGHRSMVPLADGLADLAQRLGALSDDRLTTLAKAIPAQNWAMGVPT